MANANPGASAPTVFNFISQTLRVILRNGEPWFVAADVCAALTIGNNRDATARLDDDERGVGIIDTPSGQQEMTIINESGLYSLILTSRKPEAKKFKKWVTSEVLPAIRKTGSYHATPPQPTPDAALEVLNAKDMGNLTRLVWLVCNGLSHENAWSQAVWYRLRQATGTPAPNRFKVRDLPILAAEIRRSFALTNALKAAQTEAAGLLMKRVLRGGEPEAALLAQARQALIDATQADAAALEQRLERWHDADIAKLTERAQETYFGDYLIPFNETAGATGEAA
ncbi:MAG: Bro-N domain-containing protein [Zoogloeaceae bacterium]|nr:Bro-N domain-containing protein [Zoogloeaceae bacterium]